MPKKLTQLRDKYCQDLLSGSEEELRRITLVQVKGMTDADENIRENTEEVGCDRCKNKMRKVLYPIAGVQAPTKHITK